MTALKLQDAWFGRGTPSLRLGSVTAPRIPKEESERVIVHLLLENILKEDFHFTPYSTISYLLPGSRAQWVETSGKAVFMKKKIGTLPMKSSTTTTSKPSTSTSGSPTLSPNRRKASDIKFINHEKSAFSSFVGSGVAAGDGQSGQSSQGIPGQSGEQRNNKRKHGKQTRRPAAAIIYDDDDDDDDLDFGAFSPPKKSKKNDVKNCSNNGKSQSSSAAKSGGKDQEKCKKENGNDVKITESREKKNTCIVVDSDVSDESDDDCQVEIVSYQKPKLSRSSTTVKTEKIETQAKKIESHGVADVSNFRENGQKSGDSAQTFEGKGQKLCENAKKSGEYAQNSLENARKLEENAKKSCENAQKSCKNVQDKTGLKNGVQNLRVCGTVSQEISSNSENSQASQVRTESSELTKTDSQSSDKRSGKSKIAPSFDDNDLENAMMSSEEL